MSVLSTQYHPVSVPSTQYRPMSVLTTQYSHPARHRAPPRPLTARRSVWPRGSSRDGGSSRAGRRATARGAPPPASSPAAAPAGTGPTCCWLTRRSASGAACSRQGRRQVRRQVRSYVCYSYSHSQWNIPSGVTPPRGRHSGFVRSPLQFPPGFCGILTLAQIGPLRSHDWPSYTIPS